MMMLYRTFSLSGLSMTLTFSINKTDDAAPDAKGSIGQRSDTAISFGIP